MSPTQANPKNLNRLLHQPVILQDFSQRQLGVDSTQLSIPVPSSYSFFLM